MAGSKANSFLRKRIASLKRNFYTLPFAIICIASCFFLSILFMLIKSVGRIDFKQTSIFLFIAVFASVLSIVASVNYTIKVYGQKRPLKMLVIYYVLTAICLAFTITIFYFNDKQILAEITKRDALKPLPDGSKPAEWYTYQTYINYGNCSRMLLIIFFILEGIANGLLIASPLFEKKLKSINFDQTFGDGKN